MLTLSRSRKLISILKISDFFTPICFLYFCTLHADKLQYVVGDYAVRLNNLVAFILLLLFFFRFGKESFTFPKAIALPLILLTGSILLSLFFSQYKARCMVFFLWHGFTCICYFWLPYQLIQKFEAKRILRLYFLSFIFVGFLALLNLPAFFQSHFLIRPSAAASEPSYYALYMTPFIAIATLHYLYNQNEDFYLCQSLGGFTLFLLYLLFYLCCSTSAFVCHLLLLILCFFAPYRKKALKYLLTSVAALLTLLLLFTNYVFTLMAKILVPKFFLHYWSFTERWEGLKDSWAIFLHHPLFGVGLGALPMHRLDRWLTNEISIPPYNSAEVIVRSARPFKFFESSNVTVEFIASLGLVGCLALVFFCTSFCLIAVKSFKKNRMWTLNFFLSSLIMLIILQINQGIFRTYVWTHLALAYAYFGISTESA